VIGVGLHCNLALQSLLIENYGWFSEPRIYFLVICTFMQVILYVDVRWDSPIGLACLNA